MSNAQKAIFIGVGLFICIIIVAVVLLITNIGQGITNDATDITSSTMDTLSKQLITRYNGQTMTVADVKNFLNMYLGKLKISLTCNGTINEYSTTEDINTKHINPNAKYYCTIIDNGEYIFASFIAKDETDLKKTYDDKEITSSEAINLLNTFVERTGQTSYKVGFGLLMNKEEAIEKLKSRKYWRINITNTNSSNNTQRLNLSFDVSYKN